MRSVPGSVASAGAGAGAGAGSVGAAGAAGAAEGARGRAGARCTIGLGARTTTSGSAVCAWAVPLMTASTASPEPARSRCRANRGDMVKDIAGLPLLLPQPVLRRRLRLFAQPPRVRCFRNVLAAAAGGALQKARAVRFRQGARGPGIAPA